MCHPVAIAAVVVLLVNDHLLKSRWPGPVTGKVSDLAGLVFFPLLLASIWELIARITGHRPSTATPKVVIGCILITAAGFIAVKVSSAASDLYVDALEQVTGSDHEIVLDATDLFTLPAVALAWFVHRSTWRQLASGERLS